MGGKGVGHKSVRALLSRQANMQKARAARRRPPLPWRSGMESRVIEQLVWQWFQSSDKLRVTSDEQATARQKQVPRDSDQCSVVSGEQAKARRQQVPHTFAGKRTVRDDMQRDSGSRAGRVVSGQKSEMLKSRRTSQSEALRYKGELAKARQQQVPHHRSPTAGDRVRNDMQRDSGSRVLRASGQAGAVNSAPTTATANRAAGRVNPAPTGGSVQLGSPRIVARVEERRWSRVRVARLLGVSHTWVNKLVKKFEADPEGMRRKMREFAPANLEELERAREDTRREREMGRLRGPIRWRRVKVTIQGKRIRMAAPTKEEMRRRLQRDSASRAGAASSAPTKTDATLRSSGQASDQCQVTSETKQQQVPHTAGRRPIRNDNLPVTYRELPSWARGLMLAGDAGVGMRGAGSSMRTPQVKTGTPKPVPFAFRRRR